MSTRTIIRFKQGKEFVDVYQHSDGYPSWTIPELERFLKWNGIRNEDLSYSVANFVTFGKLESLINRIEWAKENKKSDSKLSDSDKNLLKPLKELLYKQESNMSSLHTGYGIVGKLSDVELNDSAWGMEYHYVIDFPDNTEKDHFDRDKNIEIPIIVYIPAKDHLKKIGTCTFSTKEGKITNYSKGLLKEIENL